MMDTQSQSVAALLMEKLREGAGVDILSFVKEYVPKYSHRGLTYAFEQILNEPKAFDLHSHALAGMRILADRGILSKDQAKTLLEKTEREALRFGNEEFYKSIGAIARYEETASALLEFVENKLIGQEDIPDWRYLAFVAIAAIRQNNSIDIPEWLKKHIIALAQNEIKENPKREEEIRDFVKYNLT